MAEALQPYFEWPTLPFSVLMCVVLAYWLLMILSGIDLDIFDFDLDVDTDFDADASIFDWGMVGLKWFNLGEVPLMIWVTAFTLPAWLISAYFDRSLTDPTTQELITAVLRTTGIGLLIAKAVTQPMRGMMKAKEPNTVREMIGRTCVITTVEATDSFGQAKCQQDGAPLMLNVQTTGETVPQGTVVEIVDYASEGRTYIVRAASTELTGEQADQLPA